MLMLNKAVERTLGLFWSGLTTGHRLPAPGLNENNKKINLKKKESERKIRQ